MWSLLAAWFPSALHKKKDVPMKCEVVCSCRMKWNDVTLVVWVMKWNHVIGLNDKATKTWWQPWERCRPSVTSFTSQLPFLTIIPPPTASILTDSTLWFSLPLTFSFNHLSHYTSTVFLILSFFIQQYYYKHNKEDYKHYKQAKCFARACSISTKKNPKKLGLPFISFIKI